MANANLDALGRITLPARLTHAFEDVGCEMAYLGGPRGMVAGDDEGTVVQPHRPDVSGHGLTDDLLPPAEEGREHIGARPTEAVGHRAECLREMDRPAEMPATVVGPWPPGLAGPTVPLAGLGTVAGHGIRPAAARRPPATSTTRSALTTGGGSTAVVSST